MKGHSSQASTSNINRSKGVQIQRNRLLPKSRGSADNAYWSLFGPLPEKLHTLGLTVIALIDLGTYIVLRVIYGTISIVEVFARHEEIRLLMSYVFVTEVGKVNLSSMLDRELWVRAWI